MLDVQGDASLASVEPDEEARLTVDEGVVVTGKISLAYPLYLDDLSPEVGHMTRADRCRNRMFECHDADAFERVHGWPAS
jgi:hypothetical protein